MFLKTGTRLMSGTTSYIIEKVLGYGGFGITYLAHKENNALIKVAIKELFVDSLCVREKSSCDISYFNHLSDKFCAIKRDFLNETRRLQKECVHSPNIVNVGEVFEMNNTAYYVMEYLEGETLTQFINKVGNLDETQTLDLMRPVIDAVGLLHNYHITHLDIKPDNIIISHDNCGNKRPVLIDFGLAKHYDNNGNATSTINTFGASDGYAPIEQYAGITTFSPTADVYALAATMLFCLSGKQPPKSTGLTSNRIASLIPESASFALSAAIVKAMSIIPENRTQNIRQLFEDIYNKSENRTTLIETSKSTIFRTNKRTIIAASIILGAIILVILGLLYCHVKSFGTKGPLDIDSIVSNLPAATFMNIIPIVPVAAQDTTLRTPDLTYHELIGNVAQMAYHYDGYNNITGSDFATPAGWYDSAGPYIFSKDGEWTNVGDEIERDPENRIIGWTDYYCDEVFFKNVIRWKRNHPLIRTCGEELIWNFYYNNEKDWILDKLRIIEQESDHVEYDVVYSNHVFDSVGNWIRRTERWHGKELVCIRDIIYY